jgi:regulatory protein
MSDKELINAAMNKAMALCAGREICLYDIRQKLINWGVEDEGVNLILDQLTKEKFIDEERYATAFVRDKFRYNKWGKVKSAAALRSKKIPDEIIRRALDSIDDNTYMELMKSLITAQKKKVKAKNEYDLKGKLLRFGLSKGFESHLLYDLLNEE